MPVNGWRAQRVRTRRWIVRFAVGALVVGAASVVSSTPAAAAGPCGPPVVSVIACENTLPGDPPSDWQVSGAGDSTIQGFATSMSVNVGETESFKINTPAKAYHIDILRVGYYQGNGARKVVSNMAPTATLPQTQPACLNGATGTGLIDCGNWAVSASWSVPTDAVSGLYLAHLVRNDTGGSSLIPFVVRNDASHSDIVVQTSDETWQAYNTYGGNSLYTCTVNCPVGQPTAYKGASKVSYNRPFHTALDDSGRSWFMYAEYDMIRFLERNGYDVSYMSGLDVSTRGPLLLNHKIFLSSAHDEYWTGAQRANVEAARDAGVNLAFFSGNEVFWKTRLEASIDGSNTANRTLTCYKETHYDTPVDPQDPPTWTGTWMDPRFSPPADGGRPQNGLTGQLFVVNSGTTDITVPAQYSKLRFWRGTRVASLSGNQSTTLDQGVGTLGYEWDVDADNGFRPAGLIDMSSTTSNTAEDFTDFGGTTQTGSTATHHLTLYRAPSGALVFGSGTVQWAWGLDNGGSSNPTDTAMQQATVNLFADMGNVQPFTLMTGLTAASRSTDATAPTSTITSPAQNANLSNGSAVTISGSATDAGGGVVAGVEVSTDGGTTWRPVTTMSNPNTSVTWTYSWVAHGSPSTTIKSRAIDDSGNVESPSSGRTVNMACPCSIWGPAVAPKTIDSGDAASIEVGVKFKVDTFGYVTGIRFYKASLNTGTHIGSLWTANGQLLASATFTNETATGWQQVNFTQPVALNKDTTYIASYFAPRGHYSADSGYFYATPKLGPAPTITNVDSPPLHALRNSNGITNGVFTKSGTSAFPTSTNDATNYYVDPVFTPQSFTTPPGQVGNVNATAGFASATVSWSAPTTGDPATAYKITPYIGSTAQTPTTVPGNPAPTSAAIAGLTNGTTYTFTVTASNPAGTGPESANSNAVTPSSSALHVNNGDFENGINSWTTGGASSPTASGVQVHSGAGSALLGTVQPAVQPNGDSSLSQAVDIPPTGTTTLTFWYRPSTVDDICSGAACAFDWQEAQIRNSAGQTLASIFKSNSNSQTWTKVTVDMTPYAGQSVVLWFNVHQDGTDPPDDTWMYLDDVTLTQPSVPGAPTGVTATAGNGSASVSWTAPSDNGGSTITKYTVTPYIGTTAQTPTTVTGTPPGTSTTVSGLTNGTSYTFKVSASNANGTGPDSAASNAVTPNAQPGAPTGVTATAGNASATVSWTAPTNNGGSTITKYTVTPYIGTTAQTPTTVTGAPPATSTTVTGLTNGTTYTFKVSATNVNGTGPDSAASNAVTPSAPSLPGAPTGVTATAGNASAAVSWTAPSNTGGSTITKYTVTPFIGTTAQTPTTVTGNPAATSTTVSGLTNGTAYTFTVSATNATGTGPASSPSNAVTPSAAPTVTSVTPAAGATGVATSVTPTATFSQAVVPSTVTFTLQDSGGNTVSGTVGFNPGNTVATFTPSSALGFSTTYTAAVSGAQNSNGTPMAGPFVWNFTTSGPQCPCSVWDNGTPTDSVDEPDANAVNLGLQFRASSSGFVSGVRFYKEVDNTGSHIGSLWSSTGTLLASGTFSGES
ncbi:MAG TPA: N,N-dimethylformamidase beta subunit family domain-containing protein, partial [Mycobacterium sp.]|nr:N,N-dimethylformamidase beta subunit family domain-containing protein [Mycobacterium sp.]